MIRLWFRALARKFLSGRQLQTRSRSAPRRRARPRLEVLEDRTVTSTLNLEPPGLVEPPQALMAHAASDEIENQTTPADTGAASIDSANVTGLDGPAFERILEDLQRLEDRQLQDLQRVGTPVVSAPDYSSSNGPAPVSDSPWFAAYGVADNLAPLSSPGGVARSGNIAAPPAPPAPASVSLSPGAERTATAQLSAPGDVARPDKNIGLPGANRNDGNAAVADLSRVSQARPAAAPEAQVPQARPGAAPGSNGASTGASNSPHAANVAPASAHQADQALITNVAARPRQQHSDLAGSKANGAALPMRPAGAAEIPAVRSEVNGLSAGLPDGSLLQKYVADREQSAFTALFQRHERFVLRICQRVLGDSHVAQDAFQLTFLVLARQAAVLDRQGSLAGWLYKVAYHLALRLRAVIARQRRCEKQAAAGRSFQDASECFAEIEKQEMGQALHEELERLPEKYRTPLVLCYFDGRTHAEAARALGMPRGSMAKRIGEGLERLRQRLLDRGFLP